MHAQFFISRRGVFPQEREQQRYRSRCHTVNTRSLRNVLVSLQALPAVVEEQPRFATAWQHLGFLEYLDRTGGSAPALDARWSWPGFFAAAAFVLLGLSGYFDKAIRLIPPGVAAGLLAGILLQFGVNAFGGASADPVLVIVLVISYALLKRYTSRFAVVGILAIGVGLLIAQGRIDFSAIHLSLAAPVFETPRFSLQALLGVALPLFIITLTGQYMPGMLVLRNDGYQTSANPILAVTGLGSLLMAPFGAHAFNVAAITAAICTGPDAHPDAAKRWTVGVIYGLFYLVVALFAAPLAGLFIAMPMGALAVITGLALIAPLTGSLTGMMGVTEDREAAVLTFAATASGVTLFGVGSAFWGLAVGFIALTARRWIKARV